MVSTASHIGLALAVLLAAASPAAAQPARPNILWIVSEDNGPHLGAYGDSDARTPHLDALASRGVRYTRVWSTSPVCAPARTALITGMYPAALGGEHMRSLVRLPEGVRLFPALLRQAGYYTSNNEKQDYNVMEAGDAPGDGRTPPAWRGGPAAAVQMTRDVATRGVWDDSSAGAHWRNRRAGQPFFVVFNILSTHESRVQAKPAPATHDRATIHLPASTPDLPESRADWAAYHDNMTVMDAAAGALLSDLAADGLTDDTIVFYYGDNGPGLPNAKRFVNDLGMHVPLVVHVPARFRHLAAPDYRVGGSTARPIAFVDMAPTVLSLAGLTPPRHMQGRAFMGPHIAPAPRYLFGGRGRIDERYDLLRSVRDERYVYIRNYMPHKPAGQYTWYAALMPSWQAWRTAFTAGTLSAAHARYFQPKPAEELYDLQSDPDQARNLAAAPALARVRDRLRAALVEHMRSIRDTGFLPEYLLHRGRSPWELAAARTAYDVAAILRVASEASDPAVTADRLSGRLESADAVVRYWAALGLLVRGAPAVHAHEAVLLRLLDDPEPGPRCAAGEALATAGSGPVQARALATLLELSDVSRHPEYVALLALNALVQVPSLPETVRVRVAALPRAPVHTDQRQNNITHLVDQIATGIH